MMVGRQFKDKFEDRTKNGRLPSFVHCFDNLSRSSNIMEYSRLIFRLPRPRHLISPSVVFNPIGTGQCFTYFVLGGGFRPPPFSPKLQEK